MKYNHDYYSYILECAIFYLKVEDMSVPKITHGLHELKINISKSTI